MPRMLSDLIREDGAMYVERAFRSEDNGLHSWPYDFTMASAGSTPQTSLQPYLVKIWVPTTRVFSHIWTITSATAAATLVAGSNRVGLYNSAGTLLSQSADVTAWAANTAYKHALAAAQTVTGGRGVFVWLARLMSATTMPTLQRNIQMGSGSIENLNIPTHQLRYANLAAVASGAGLPASFAPATALAANINNFWIGASSS